MRDVLEAQVAVDRIDVHLSWHLGILEYRPQLRGEPERGRRGAVEQRLLANTVTREHQPPTLLVPEREREHTPQPLDALDPELLVEVHDHFGVGARGELVTLGGQLFAQLEVVVDLAVEYDNDRPILVVDRLVTGVQIDHRQSLDAESDAVLLVRAARIGTPVLDRVAHAREQPGVHRPSQVDLAHNPAHAANLPDGPGSAPDRDRIKR
jgi:hypothetical protein